MNIDKPYCHSAGIKQKYMTLQECKEQIAQEYCFQDWSQVQRIVGSDEMHDLLNAVAKLYASEKVKEALKLAADRAEVIFENGYTNVETPHKQIVYDGNTFKPNRALILSLESELLNNINKEI